MRIVRARTRAPTSGRSVAIMRLSRAALPVAVLAAGLVVLPPATTPASAAPPTCHGKRATVVGSPGAPNVKGTKRSDVIVSNGNGRVYGLAGNDLICITKRTATTRVFDGPGNDVVEARGAAGPISADMYTGNDVFYGTRFADRFRDVPVYLGSPPSGGADTVYAGAGNDVVEWTNDDGRDRVQLGPGDDRLEQLLRARGAVTEVGAGSGDDEIRLISDPGTFSVDVRGSRVDGPTRRIMGIDGFERYDLAALSTSYFDGPKPPARVTFSGSDADEVVDMGRGYDTFYDSDFAPVDRAVKVYLGGGDDVLTYRANDSGPVSGGPGVDQVTVDGASALVGDGDLTARTFEVTDSEDPTYRAAFRPVLWETVLVEDFFSVLLNGAAGPETLGVLDSGSSELHGRGGDDVLTGGPGDDTLTGGEGTDRADGNGGTDTCDAETTVNCELP